MFEIVCIVMIVEPMEAYKITKMSVDREEEYAGQRSWGTLRQRRWDADDDPATEAENEQVGGKSIEQFHEKPKRDCT